MIACAKPDLWRPWEVQNCQICHSEFKRVGELKRLCKSCQFPKIRVCCICNEQFTRKDNLTRHMKSKHDDNFKPSCEFCKKHLSRQDSAARHQRTCHKNPTRQGSISPVENRTTMEEPRSEIQRPNVIVSVASLKFRSEN
ncbi:unnamed protein product [Allacma fusca]|uniref:C2H2-type domain-containing protein n=1 Tax=Allacma fusca TaxID=39272 RepID=A0A8J2NRL9_9HEXA|nr:unnamed protein product [Allacma fusca]